MRKYFLPKYTKEEILTVYRMWAGRCKTRDIAKATGMSEGYITRVISKGLIDGDIEERRVIKCE